MDVDFYPVQEQLVKDASQAENSVFLVDVGGGKGHDLQELHHKQPELPGKLILQDLPDVIKEAQAIGLDSKIEPMGHDFFAEQPVIGLFALCNLCLDANNGQVHEPTICTLVCMTGAIAKHTTSS